MTKIFIIFFFKIFFCFEYLPKKKVFQDATIDQIKYNNINDELEHLEYCIHHGGQLFNSHPASYLQMEMKLKNEQITTEQSVNKIKIASCTSDSTFTINDDCHNYFSQKRFEKQENDPITLSFSIDSIRRISYMWIHWKLAPQSLTISFSQNGFTYEQPQTFDLSQNSFQFPQLIQFDTPVYFKFARLQMAKPKKFFTIGIEEIQIWTKNFQVMIKSLAYNQNSDLCLINQLNFGTEIFGMRCVDAISLADQREIFLIELDFVIKSFQGFCLNRQKNKLQIEQCQYSNDKWIFDLQGRIINEKTEQCVTMLDKQNSIDIKTAQASSELDDQQHGPKRAIDGNSETYWASQEKNPTFTVNFEKTQTVSEIQITWKYIPKSFDVLYQIESIWKNIRHVTDNYKSETQIKFIPKVITAIKIQFIENDPIYGLYQGHSIFGITQIELKRDFYQVQLQDCSNGEIDKSNRWILEDVNIIDQVSKPALQLIQVTNLLLEILQKLIKIPKQVSKMLKNQAQFKLDIQQIKKEMTNLENTLSIFQQVFPMQKTFPGSSFQNPVKYCYKISQLYKNKMSGYYWIQPECVNKPIRVYCDLTQNQDFFYVPNVEKLIIKKREDIIQVCGKNGLYPVEIYNESQIDLITYYLNDMQIDLMTSKVVPMGFDYTCQEVQFLQKGQCQKNYKSFSSQESISISSKLQSLLDPYNLFNQPFTQSNHVMNSIGLGLSKQNMFQFELGTQQILGVICSTNLRNANTQNLLSNLNNLDIDCYTSPRGNYNFDGQFITVQVFCPTNCQNNEAQIWGNYLYKDDSSICKAAIHAGELTNDGGPLEVSIKEGQDSYQSEKNHSIQSLFYDKWDRSFEIKKLKYQCPYDKKIQNIKENSFLEINQITNQNNKQQEKQNEQQIQTKQEFQKDFNQVLIIDSDDFSKTRKLTEDCRIFTQNLFKLFQPLEANKFLSEIKIQQVTQKNLQSVIENLMLLSKNYLSSMLEKYQQKLQIKLEYLKYENYQENYLFSFQDIYSVENPTSGQSQWSFTQINLKQHTSQISQQNNLSDLSYIYIKNKDFYDFNFNFSFYQEEYKKFQILLHYQNKFNYYAIELGQQIQCIKYLNGQSYILKTINQGVQLNQWIQISIEFKKWIIQMKMLTEKNRDKNFEGLQSIFSVEDHDISRGFLGWATQGIVYIDDVSLAALNCQQPDISYNYQEIIPPTCNRYKESFFGIIESQWEHQSKQKSWKFLRNTFQRPFVIYQENSGLDKSIIILKQKYCNEGEFNVNFMGQDDGIIGIVFQYINDKKYYSLELTSTQIRFKKKIEQQESTLAFKETQGYIVNQWYKLKILINKTKFQFYLGKISEISANIFDKDIFDNLNTIQDGQIGLLTQQTKCAFDQIVMKPLQQIEVQPPIYFKPEKKSFLESDVCILSQTPETRSNYCIHEFQDQFQINKCQKSFCETCCERSFNWLHLIQRHACMRQCKDYSLPTDNEDIWKSCVELQNQKQNNYRYCDDKFEKSFQNVCKTDICNLCCVTISQQKNQNVLDKTIDTCRKKCLEIFTNKQIVVV